MKKYQLIYYFLFLLVLAKCFTSCIDKYSYLNDYLGSWEFTVYYYHKVYPSGAEDTSTIVFEGVINKGNTEKKLLIQYSETEQINAEVDENGLLILNCMQPSSCFGQFPDQNTFEYRYSARVNSGSVTNINSRTVNGKKISGTSSLNNKPEANTRSATGISMKGALLRGSAIANYLTTAVSFDYGPTTKYDGNTIARQSKISGKQLTDITIYVQDLKPETLYHFRASAQNSLGTSYGSDMTFKTMGATDPVSDVEGNSYPTIQIDDQIWMAQNLRTKKFLNGEPIPTTPTIMTDISTEPEPVYQWVYDGVESYAALFGRLYTWYAANDNRKICPAGWHIPSRTELDTLIKRIDPYSGGILKEAGLSHWASPNEGATNTTGFTALPGGNRVVLANYGAFSGIAGTGNWWSSSTYSQSPQLINEKSAIAYSLINYGSKISTFYFDKNTGMSVRCLKDQ